MSGFLDSLETLFSLVEVVVVVSSIQENIINLEVFIGP